eukprot:162960_1
MGICNTDYFDSNIFCELNGIEPTDQYNKCCNNNNNNNPTSPSPISLSLTDCNNNNTLTINKTGTFTHSVTGNFYKGIDSNWEDLPQPAATICIAISSQTQCINPTITVMFEQIDYD